MVSASSGAVLCVETPPAEVWRVQSGGVSMSSTPLRSSLIPDSLELMALTLSRFLTIYDSVSFLAIAF
jgi:hypothetical protein